MATPTQVQVGLPPTLNPEGWGTQRQLQQQKRRNSSKNTKSKNFKSGGDTLVDSLLKLLT